MKLIGIESRKSLRSIQSISARYLLGPAPATEEVVVTAGITISGPAAIGTTISNPPAAIGATFGTIHLEYQSTTFNQYAAMNFADYAACSFNESGLVSSSSARGATITECSATGATFTICSAAGSTISNPPAAHGATIENEPTLNGVEILPMTSNQYGPFIE